MLGTHSPIVRERLHEFGEAEGQQLESFPRVTHFGFLQELLFS
jgi:hypothetical protein